MKKISRQAEFIWDKGNLDKNWHKHKVKYKECEEVFFDQDKNEYPDPKHSTKEVRKIMVGKTKAGRYLFMVYTIRKNSVRVISARDINKRERKLL